MSANPPLRKPRHADGRLMSEDEISGLDGRDLDRFVAVCAGGYVEGGFDMERDPGDDFEANRYGIPLNPICPHYSTDIAAAFTVNRPRWRWVQDEFSNGGICVMVWDYPEHLPHNSETVQGGEYEVELGHQPTPSDHAKARCIAALLLAAKIGE